jgi:hypothetical protein
MNTTDLYLSKTSQREMAAGVLKQAEKDLRRFYGGTTGVERELYLDAYQWIMADDCAWPFSFVNVCDLMGFTPSHVRQELIGDHSLGIFGYQMRRCGRMVSRLQTSLARLLARERNPEAGYAC